MEVVRLKDASYAAARIIHDLGAGHNGTPPAPITPLASPVK